MGTENYNLPQINGLGSVKIPRDFNALSEAVDRVVSNEIARVNTTISTLRSGLPKGTYATLAELQAAKPTGDEYAYIVLANGNWYYWNGTSWQSGGVYQSAGIPDNSIDSKKLAFKAVVGGVSRNLFNKDTAVDGKYISITDGLPTTSANYSASDFIPVTPNTVYTPKNTMLGGAYYDGNKTFLSGMQSTGTFKTPSNAMFVRISMLTSLKSTQQLELGATSTRFVAYDSAVKKETLPLLTKEVMDPALLLDVTPSRNLFNPETITSGKYLNTNGTLGTNANFSISDFIPVQAGLQYVVKKYFNVGLYKDDKTFIGLTSSNPFTISSDTAFVRVVTNNTDGSSLNTQQFELGATSTPFVSYGNKIKVKDIVDLPQASETIHVTVAASGGDFTSIATAIASIGDASEKKRYIIHVKNGTYAETFRTKDYVDISGEDKYKTIINYVGVPANWVNESTIFADSDSTIENMTIYATNSKYPVHSDAATGDYRLVIKNCVLEHKGFTDGTNPAGTALGIGLYKNQHIEVLDCEIIGSGVFGVAGVFCHNANSSAGNGYRSLAVRNCKVKKVSYGFRINGISPTFDQRNDAFLINNDIQATTAEVMVDATTDLSWNIVCRGNTLNRVFQPNNQYIVEQPGFTRRIKNGGPDITRGMVVQLVDTGAGRSSNSGDSPLVVGVALEDITSGNIGVIQVSGYVNALKVNGTTAIATDNFISTHTEAGVAKKAGTNPFALAKGSYATADSNGFIPAILLPIIFK